MTPVQPTTPIDPASFGLVGDGTPNVLANFQAFLNAVGVAQGTGVFGPGFFDIEIASQNANPNYAQLPTNEITLSGAGRTNTAIRLVPEGGNAPASGFFSELFRFGPDGGKLTLRDLALLGPSAWDDSTNPHVGTNGEWPTANSFGITLHGATGAVELRMDGCTLGDYFTNGISFDDNAAASVTVILTDCDLSAFGSVAGIGAAEGDTRKVVMRDCRFHSAGIPAARAGGRPWNHVLYFNPGVETLLDNCSFENCELNAGQWFSGHGIGPAGAKVTLLNCRAFASVAGSFILPPGGQVIGGKYSNGQGLELAAGSVVNGATLDCPVNNGFAGGAPVYVVGCTLLNLCSVNIVGGYAVLSACNAQRGVDKASGQQLAPAVAPTGGTTLVEGVSWFGGDIRLTGADRRPATAPIAPRGTAKVLVRGGMSAGDHAFYGGGQGTMMIGNLAEGDTPTIDVEGHVFDLQQIPGWPTDDPQPAIYCDASAPANSVTARTCAFLSGCMPFSVTSPQNIEPRPGTCPRAVRAAPVVNLIEGFNYNTFRVTGSADIGQITISNFDNVAYRVYNQRCWVGRLTLLAVDGFRLIDGGGSPGGITGLYPEVAIPAGTAVVLEHSPDTCTWAVVG